MVREGDTWREVSWDEAFRRCDELLAPVIAEHGIEAVTAYVGNPLAHNFSLGRYIGDPHRHVGHPDDLLGRHRRPVAEERQLAPHVRRHVEDPRARHPPHRPARRHGRQPPRLAGLAARLPRRDGRDRRHPRAGRQGHRRSTPAAPAPPSGPTSGCRSRPAPTPPCCSPWPTSLFAEDLVDLGTVADLPRRASTSCASARGRLDARAGGARHRHRRRPDPRAGPRARRHRAGRRLRAHRRCATRSSARWPAGWSTSSTSSPATSTCPAALMFPRPAAWPVTDLPMPGLEGGVAELRPLADAGAGRARGARPRPGVVPRRGDRHAGRGPDPGAVHRRRQPGAVDARAATASTPRSAGSTA